MSPDELVDQFMSVSNEDLLLLTQQMAHDKFRDELIESIIDRNDRPELASLLIGDEPAIAKAKPVLSNRIFLGCLRLDSLRPPIWDLASSLVASTSGRLLASEFARSSAGQQFALELVKKGGTLIVDVFTMSKTPDAVIADQLHNPGLKAAFESRNFQAKTQFIAALQNGNFITEVEPEVRQYLEVTPSAGTVREYLSSSMVDGHDQKTEIDNTEVVLTAIAGSIVAAGLVTVLAALDTDGAPEIDPVQVQSVFDQPYSSRHSVAKQLGIPSWHLWQFLEMHNISKQNENPELPKPKAMPKRSPVPTPILSAANGATPEQCDHQNQQPLIDALDVWFNVLRDRLQEPIPLKPANDSEIAFLAETLKTDLPPDVEALYRYTNGAWRDSNTPLEYAFLPDAGSFQAIPAGKVHSPSMKRSKTEQWRPLTMTIHSGGIKPRGDAFDDLPGDEYLKEVPIIHFEDGHQLSIISADTTYQAVALFGTDGMHWAARRLADTINYAIKWEELGLINWRNHRITIDSNYRMKPAYPIPANPDHFQPITGQDYTHAHAYQGWIWEPLT